MKPTEGNGSKNKLRVFEKLSNLMFIIFRAKTPPIKNATFCPLFFFCFADSASQYIYPSNLPT